MAQKQPFPRQLYRVPHYPRVEEIFKKKMKQGLLLWSPCYLSPPSFHSISLKIPSTKHTPRLPPISASLDSTDTQLQLQQQLSARERRQLRNERRESKSGYNWREEVEERLIKKPKKRYTSWTEELNLDNLAHLGPQWWVVRVSRVRGLETAEVTARLLARNFPDIEFKVNRASIVCCYFYLSAARK